MTDEDAPATYLSPMVKWAIGIMVPVFLSGGAMQLMQTVQLNTVLNDVAALTKSTTKMASTLEELIIHDMSDLKTRLTLMESKRILPEAVDKFKDMERQHTELNRRIRVLEIRDGMNE